MPAHTHSAHTANKYVATAVALVACTAAVGLVLGLVARLGWLGGSPTVAESAWPIALSSKRLDFGRVPIHGEVVRQLVVRNDGPSPVRATIDVDGAAYSVSPESLILHPGVSSRISVVAKADAPGSLSDRLRIQLEDDTSAVVIALDGEATDGSDTAAPAAVAPPLRANGAPGEDPQGTTLVASNGPSRADRPRRPVERTAVPPAAERADRPTPVPSAAAPAPGNATSRTRNAPADASDDDRDPRRDAERAWQDRNQSVQIMPYDASTAAPFRGISDAGSAAADSGPETGSRLPSTIPGADDDESGLPSELPDDLGGPNGDRRQDVTDNDDPSEPDRPFDTPMMSISGTSTVRLLGATVGFYPQQLGVIGGAGSWGLAGTLELPQIPLAFGESILFAQTGNVTGAFDPSSGLVTAQLPLQAVDSDGDAAPILVNLTTGSVTARNQAGAMVTLSGSARDEGSGALRLVAIEKIPSGYRNGGEEHLVVFEILATLRFAPDLQPRPDGFSRIGG